ncbi:hypothetical protein BDW74DRAFT_183931 [Aspergillus multicolor]|uniref:uncharacterized protein n=1 Tax=Aspergillus multicolor TaxID=41759 RepID=UPI003CCCA511
MEDPPFPYSGLETSGGRGCFVTTIVALVILCAGAVLRVWVQVKRRRPVKAHDYFYFAGFVMAIAYSTTFLYAIYPLGLEMFDYEFAAVYPNRAMRLLKLITTSPILWAIATTLVKLCLLGLFWEIFTRRRDKWIIGVIAALSIMLGLAGVLLGCLMCQPFAYNWDKTIEGGHCGNSDAMQLALSWVNMIIELMIILLPTSILWKLQMPWRSKVILNIVFSLGLCVCAMNLTRIILVYLRDRTGFTYSILLTVLLCTLDVNIGLICASAPTLASLVVTRRGASDENRSTPSPVINSFARRRMKLKAQLSRSQRARGNEISLLSMTTDDNDLTLQDTSGAGRSLGATSSVTEVPGEV